MGITMIRVKEEKENTKRIWRKHCPSKMQPSYINHMNRVDLIELVFFANKIIEEMYNIAHEQNL